MNIYQTFRWTLCSFFTLSLYGAQLENKFLEIKTALLQQIEEEYPSKNNLNSPKEEFNRVAYFQHLLEPAADSYPALNKPLACNPSVVENIIHAMERQLQPLPVDIERVILHYVVPPSQHIATARKKIIQMLRGKCFIPVSVFPADFKELLPPPTDLSEIFNRYRKLCGYSLLHVIKSFLRNKSTKKNSSVRLFGAVSQQKSKAKYTFRTYQEIKEKGWENLSFLMAKTLRVHCLSKSFIRDEVLDPDVRLGIELFIPPYYRRYCIGGIYWDDFFEAYALRSAD